MKLVPLKCPSCSANLELPGDRESAFCTYCGTKILITSEATGPDLQSLMKLADIAYEAGNTEEALHLYNRALEIQPKNSHAWVRKALCTAGETRANEIRARVKETVAYLNKARESDSPQLKEIEEAQDKIRDDMARFANVMTAKSSESAQQLWSGDYLGGGPMYQQGMKEALSYCSIALEVDPENVQALENRMFVLKKLGWLSNRTEIKEIQAKVARIKSARP